MSESASYFKTERGSERSFGIVFALFFLLVTIFIFFRKGEIVYWAPVLSSTFGLAAWLYPKLLKPLNFLWFKLGILLGAVIAPFVMLFIFFLIVTPTGFALRTFGKDPLSLKRNLQQKSYWIPRKPEDDELSSMKNQF